MATGTLETVKERTDIAELIGEKVQLRQTGRTFKGLCPFHNEKSPSFVVYPETQSYHCFGCGKTGDAFTFLMETENLDFRDALKLLAERAGVQLESQQRPQRDDAQNRERERLIELNDRAAGFFSSLLWTSPHAQAARSVLERRGLDRPTAERFGVGFAPDSFDALKSHFLSRGMTEEELLAAGLLSKNEQSGRTYDRFRNRITFPIRNREGQTIGFGARAIGEEKPKYLNSPQTAIFDKRSVLYALDKAYDAIRRERSIVIVEGYMDAITAHQFGYENVVASMGTAVTPNQVSAIRRYLDRVFLALDSDAAGQLATLRGIDSMRESFTDDERVEVRPGQMVRFERTLGAEIRVVILPEGKDPDEFIRAHPSEWPAILQGSMPLVEYYLTQSLSTVEPSPSARARALQETAVPILREIGDPVVLSHYVGTTARLLGFKDTDVHSAVLRGASRRVAPGQPKAVIERPSARDPEPYLISLILRFPQAGVAALTELDRDDVVEARHREILDALYREGGDLDRALTELPEEVAAYARSLIAQAETPVGTIPLSSSQELPRAVRRLAQVRFETRFRQLQAELSAAKQDNDQEAIAEHVRRIDDLMQRKAAFDPLQSPYFRDLRSEAS